MKVQVDADFADALLEWFDLLEQEGVQIKFTSGLRSVQEQSRLYARLGRAGLAARPGKSYHNYGLAIDFVAAPRAAQSVAGALAESVGLRWGGRFHPADPVHIDAGNFLPLDEARRQGFPGELVTLED